MVGTCPQGAQPRPRQPSHPFGAGLNPENRARHGHAQTPELRSLSDGPMGTPSAVGHARWAVDGALLRRMGAQRHPGTGRELRPCLGAGYARNTLYGVFPSRYRAHPTVPRTMGTLHGLEVAAVGCGSPLFVYRKKGCPAGLAFGWRWWFACDVGGKKNAIICGLSVPKY